MDEQQIKEKKYLQSISECNLAKNNPFIIDNGDGKELSVIASDSNHLMQELDKISTYRTLYDTAYDLASKIAFSLKNAIEYSYSKEVLNQFDMIHTGGKEEWIAYYNIENALFRIESLWDILAQIYNVKYSLRENIKNVYHNRIFSDNKKYVNKYWNSGVPSEVQTITNYIREEDDTEVVEGKWKGNYKYVNSLRNTMTHRLSISRSSLSSYAFCHLKSSPHFILRRTAECFAMLQNFTLNSFQNIIGDIENFEK